MSQEVRRELPTHVIAVGVAGLLLIAQGLWSFRTRPEPYPSIRMPSFALTASADGNMPVTFARVEAVGIDGSTRTIPVPDLMSEFNYSLARPSFDHVFQDAESSTLDPEVKAWVRKRIEALHPGFRPTEVRMCWERTDVSVVDASMTPDPCNWKTITL